MVNIDSENMFEMINNDLNKSYDELTASLSNLYLYSYYNLEDETIKPHIERLTNICRNILDMQSYFTNEYCSAEEKENKQQQLNAKYMLLEFLEKNDNFCRNRQV